MVQSAPRNANRNADGNPKCDVHSQENREQEENQDQTAEAIVQESVDTPRANF